MKKLKIALIGLGFGGCFADIYHEHPDVGELVVFDTDKALEKVFRDKLGITRQYDSLDEILKDDTVAVSYTHLTLPTN